MILNNGVIKFLEVVGAIDRTFFHISRSSHFVEGYYYFKSIGYSKLYAQV